jgi:hypothetical protein
MPDFFTNLFTSILSSLLFKYIVVPLIMTSVFGGVLRFAFNKLKKGKEIVAFGIGSFLLFVILMVVVARPQQPELNGGIQNALVGQPNGGSERDTVVVFTINIINTGSMQTIVKSWKVEATANGRKYEAVFPPMPPKFTFNNIPRTSPNQPESITYKVEDNILEKALVPLQVGAILPGVLYVVFQNVDNSVFKAGVDYKITYEDVLSRQYSMSISSSGKMDNIATFPGVHTEMVCPVPPGGIPKLGNDISTPAQPK